MLFNKQKSKSDGHSAQLPDDPEENSPYTGQSFGTGPSVRRGVLAAIVTLLCAIAGVTAWANLSTSTPSAKTEIALEEKAPVPGIDQISGEPAVFQFKPVDADAAVEMNAAIPAYTGALTTAARFNGVWTSAQDQSRALDCLTAAIYYEAATETPQGQRAVAQVVINRLRDPNYPKSICGVVFQGSQRKTGCQFSFTCDGSLARPPSAPLWQRLRAIAWAAMNGQVEPSVGTATHYHTIWVVPYWQSGLQKLGVVGSHIFYTWLGSASRTARTGSTQIAAEAVPLPAPAQSEPIPPLGNLPQMPPLTDPGYGRLAAGSLPPGAIPPATGFFPPSGPGVAPTIPSTGTEPVAPPPPPPESPIAADREKGQLNADAQSGSLIQQ
jgi:spore germination cell wall hydrolase CwlJ-like protein